LRSIKRIRKIIAKKFIRFINLLKDVDMKVKHKVSHMKSARKLSEIIKSQSESIRLPSLNPCQLRRGRKGEVKMGEGR